MVDYLETLRKYKRLVRKLNYLIVTRFNIAYAISVGSQIIPSPTIHYCVALEKILHYFTELLDKVY